MQNLVKGQQVQRPSAASCYRDTSLIRNRLPLGTYSRTMPRVLYNLVKGQQVQRPSFFFITLKPRVE